MEYLWSEYFYNKLYSKYGNSVNFYGIENNKNITLNFIKNNPHINWDYDQLGWARYCTGF